LAQLQLNGGSAAANPDAVWKKAGADEGLRQAFERATYALKDSGHGTWRGANAAQRLTLEFNDREARLSHPDGSVSFHLTGYGYGDRLQKPAPATLTGRGNRVEYQRGDLTEWYLNESQGLEQGFTLAQRPGTDRASEPLVIALGVSGELRPAQKADDSSALFESGKGVVLHYAGLGALDARGRILPSRLEVRGGEIRLIVEDQGAQYPLVVDPTWTQQQELTASNGAANDYFGYSVSVSGNTAVIGAFLKTINSHAGQGAAYVFVRSAGVWSQQQELTASDGAMGDQFGTSVSVSGNTVVIGAYHKGNAQGAAYVFVRSSGMWAQQQELTASDGAEGDCFGYSVSVSGDTAVIGANQNHFEQGAAYVFVRSAGVWTQQQKLTASDGAASDYFGDSVSVSGDTAVIGANYKNTEQGAAYVFVQSGTAWSQQQELTASDGAANDQFGFSVSVSGDTAVIGAYGKTINSNADQGAAYVFVRSGGTWAQQQELTASNGEANYYFGYSVSVSGDTAVIGAERAFAFQGAAYVFVSSAGVWTQQQQLTASNGEEYDFFGYSVSVSGDTAVIGAYSKQINSTVYQGAAYAFVQPRLGTNALLVGSAGGTSSVVLAYDGAWTATANDSFLHISAGSASGTSSAEVVFTYDAFTGTGTRTGTLTIAGLTVTVTQAGATYVGPYGSAVTLVSSGLNLPAYVAVDGSGNVYIGDAHNNAIKEWSASTQQVTTLVSAGLNQPSGVAVDGSGNVYIADQNNNAIKEWSPSTQQVTTLVSAGLSQPTGVAVDGSGNVYIGDQDNNAIKEWAASTQQVATLVSSGLSAPLGVSVDVSGNVYLVDCNNGAIKEWAASTQQVTTLVSGLLFPRGVAVDGSGNVYIADTVHGAIKEWSASTQQVTTLMSSGLSDPTDATVDGSGNVYIADSLNYSIKEMPYAFVGPASLIEPAPAGTDWLLPVLPSTASLSGVYAPSSDQSWLTIGTIANGVVSFSFSANTSTSRVAHITLLGQQITVTQDGSAPQTITFWAIANQPLGTAPFTISAPASSALPVSFASQTTSVCTVAGSQVTLVSVGTCTIQATQAGNINYAAATPVNQSFQVTQGSQAVNFGALANQAFGSAPFTVSATASSGLPVSFNSQTTSVCTVSGSQVTLLAVGTCTIQATQAGNANYAAATPVNQSFQVTPASSSAPVISSLSPASAAPGAAAFTLSVNGTGFISGAIVDWNGTALATTFVSATQLTASVPAALIASAGMATVTVVNPGAVTSGGVGFTIQSGPAATAVLPGAGNGTSQAFTFTFSDPSGYQNLGVLDVLINNYLDGIQACYIALVPSGANAGTLYLVDDGGNAGGPFAGNLTLPSTGSVSNSQCTVSGTGSSVVGSGTTITLTLNISFSASFAGNRVFYTAARDTGTGNSGWQALGTWQVPGATATPTQATGVTPASGSGGSQSFVFTFADSAGWQDLGVVDVLFNNVLDGIQGCYIAYSVPSATLYLVDDAGDAGGPFAGYLALPGTGSMSNSQCTVSGVGSSAAGSGNTLTLTLNVSFTGAFAGNRIFYTAAGNAASTENSGWHALGAWTVP
jgi:sugar lactone lactonase YvrE